MKLIYCLFYSLFAINLWRSINELNIESIIFSIVMIMIIFVHHVMVNLIKKL